jgi:hypothetical protein
MYRASVKTPLSVVKYKWHGLTAVMTRPKVCHRGDFTF